MTRVFEEQFQRVTDAFPLLKAVRRRSPGSTRPFPGPRAAAAGPDDGGGHRDRSEKCPEPLCQCGDRPCRVSSGLCCAIPLRFRKSPFAEMLANPRDLFMSFMSSKTIEAHLRHVTEPTGSDGPWLTASYLSDDEAVLHASTAPSGSTGPVTSGIVGECLDGKRQLSYRLRPRSRGSRQGPAAARCWSSCSRRWPRGGCSRGRRSSSWSPSSNCHCPAASARTST